MKRLLFIVLLLPIQAHAWWIFWMPGDLFSKGNNCVSVTAKVGDRLRAPDGRIGVVKSLHGPSERCSTAMPFRAYIEYPEDPSKGVETPSSG